MNDNVFLWNTGYLKKYLSNDDPSCYCSFPQFNKLNSLYFNNNIYASGIFIPAYHPFLKSIYIYVPRNKVFSRYTNIHASLLFIKCLVYLPHEQFFFHIYTHFPFFFFRYKLFSFTLPHINLDLLSRSMLIHVLCQRYHFFHSFLFRILYFAVLKTYDKFYSVSEYAAAEWHERKGRMPTYNGRKERRKERVRSFACR